MKKLLDLLESNSLLTEERSARGGGDPSQVFEKVKLEVRKLVNNIIEGLNDRLLQDKELLQNASIFVPETSANLDKDEFHGFGHDEICMLVTHFAQFQLSDMAAVVDEWNQLKYDTLNPEIQSRASTWLEVLKNCLRRSDVFPNLSVLAEILLCFCAENAEVERGFSLYNRIKTKTRNRLKIDTIDTLMRLRLNSPPWHSFDYNQAATIWLAMMRRGRYSVGQKQPEQEPEEVELEKEPSVDSEEALDAIEERANE